MVSWKIDGGDPIHRILIPMYRSLDSESGMDVRIVQFWPIGVSYCMGKLYAIPVSQLQTTL